MPIWKQPFPTPLDLSKSGILADSLKLSKQPQNCSWQNLNCFLWWKVVHFLKGGKFLLHCDSVNYKLVLYCRWNYCPFFISLLCVRNQMNFMARANQIKREFEVQQAECLSRNICAQFFFLLTCFAVSRILIGRISFSLLPPHYVKKINGLPETLFWWSHCCVL